MRFLLLQNMLYVPTFGGANKANRMLLEQLAERGHECRVIAPCTGSHGSQSFNQFAQELAARNIRVHSQSDQVCVFRYRGVEVHAVLNSDRLHRCVLSHAPLFQPDQILVSSQDPGQMLLGAALDSAVAPVVYVVHSVLDLPFGPHSVFSSPATTRLIGRVSGIITVSQFVKNYISQWGGFDSSVLRFPVYGSGPFPEWGSFEKGLVTFINPCVQKGMAIFLKLVELFPEVEFAALPTWGTTEADRAQLKSFSNVTILQPSDDIATILKETRVLLVPSLCPEAFGLIVVEAMVHGIPVMASNAGGLVEAKLGVDYVLPVNSIEDYDAGFDMRSSPVPRVPEQDMTPWQDALQDLLTQREKFEAVSRASRAAGLDFVCRIDISEFEKFFHNVSIGPRPEAGQECSQKPAVNPTADLQNTNVGNLSREKRMLLALRAIKSNSTRGESATKDRS